MNQEDKTMLALAALTYRGFGHHSEAVIASKLDPWLPELEAEGLGRWERVWGPATFRAPTSLADDAMMYVAKHRGRTGGPPRYVVAIRGTNPVSFFDWLFGDLWVRHQVEWTGAPNALLSGSTALGLAILQNLTATEPPSLAGNLAPVANALSSALQGVIRTLPELLPEELLGEPSSFTESDLVKRIGALTGDAIAFRRGVFGRLREHLDQAKKRLRQPIEREVFELLLQHIAAARGRGKTVLEFLDGAVEEGARVTVVGHSKGGALAVAAALWLAERWAPAKNETIDCFAFAGPTAGNAAFAKHYDKTLGPRTRCIINRRDVVPQAWAIANLGSIGDLYPVLGLATNALSASVASLDYTHVGGTQVVFSGASHPPRRLVQEIIYQHLDAYLEEAGLAGAKWNARSIFLDSGRLQ